MNIRRIKIFSCSVIILNLLFWIIAFVTRGNTISLYFSSDPFNTAMDYFNMLANIPEETPYIYNSNYPALPFVIWKVLYHIIPYSDAGTDGFFLREFMYAQLGYILYFTITIIVLWELLRHCIQTKKQYSYLFATAIIFSGPFLFTFERGNIILLSLIFTIPFILLYDSREKKYRYIAYLCLAVAAAIKIYPALFGLILLVKKKWKETGILILLGILFFFVPFFFFDGFSSFKTMLNGIMVSSTENVKIGFGYNFSFQNLIRIIYGFTGHFKENLSLGTLIIPLIISLIIFLLHDTEWKRLFAISLLIVWMPSFSYTYVLIFFTVPLISFLRENEQAVSKIYSLFFTLIFTAYSLPKFDKINYLLGEEFKFYLTGGMVFINLIIVLMAITIIVEGIIYKTKMLKKKTRG